MVVSPQIKQKIKKKTIKNKTTKKNKKLQNDTSKKKAYNTKDVHL
jgi:hypothetical protein